MNIIKKISAAVLVLIMVLTVAGCHPKNEIAVTVGDVEFTSAYYMCALIFADSEARSKVDEKLAEEKKDEETTSAADVNYYAEKIDGKKFADWVKDRAIESLKQIAAYKIKCKDAELKLDKETEDYANQYASYYWASYGYSALLEPNGVSQSTYTDYMVDSYYSSLYFEHLYAEGGEKEIAADEVAKNLVEKFALVDIIEVDTSSMKDEEKTEAKAKLDGYVADLTAGTKTFEQIYHEHNGTSAEEEHAKTETTDKTTEDGEEELKPLDPHSTVVGAEDTTYAYDHFDDIKAMATGEIKLLTPEEGGYILVVKLDVAADPYYVENLDLAVRNVIKGDEYEEDMNKYAKKLDTEINDYAVNQFKVKKIEYPETTGY